MTQARADRSEQFYLDHYLNEVRLLDARTLWRSCFPGRGYSRKRVGWTKSWSR